MKTRIFVETLDKHLSVLRRTGVIAPWHDRRITAGREWEHEIDKHLEEAQVILLLVSADFLASDYCWGVEMKRALAKHDAGLARVIPIMIRPVDFFVGVPFAHLQALPQDAKPITEWNNQDAAWADVAKGVRVACSEIRDRAAAHATGILTPSSIPEREEIPASKNEVSSTIFVETGFGKTRALPQQGDKVRIEVLSLLPDHTPEPGQEVTSYDLFIGAGQAIPDLEAAILNLRVGETRDFQIRFPADFLEPIQRNLIRLLRIKLVRVERSSSDFSQA